MIVIYHQNNRVCRVFDYDNQKKLVFAASSIAKVLMQTAEEHPERLLLWCHLLCQNELNRMIFPELFHHKKLLLSYNHKENYFPSAIGYIEETPFINVNKKVSYPTWQMSGLVGGIHASVLITLRKEVILKNNFDYFLCSVAKLGMPLGLLCYSEPRLLMNEVKILAAPKASIFVLFKFVKQHYKSIWVFLLFLNILIYEKKVPFFSFLFSWFYRKRKWTIGLDEISVQSTLQVVEQASIDVIIPTIGRKEYLYDILCDLRNQTHFPKNVIIVEQNSLTDSVSELDYITNEKWPFVIKHTFTHKAGACNARNIALQQVESEWIFLADDDIKIDVNFIQQALFNMNEFVIKAAIFSCLFEGQKNNYSTISQTTIFGSGCSIIKKINSENLKFKESLEFGYGEDTEFGLQLRNIGTDIIYFPEPSILHLKAPIGGFRIKPVLLWSAEKNQPKPSPSVMLLKQSYDTKQQIQGYKLFLGLKLFSDKGWRKPIGFLVTFQKQWEASLYWANQLKKNKK
jgi:glycosyltransferase involved in cell wall biosynthesis